MRAGVGGAGFGAAMIVAGMTLIGFTDNFVRVIAEDAGLWQFQLVRSAMALPLLALAAWLLGTGLGPRRWWAVAVRGGVQAAGILLYFGSLPMMPIAQAGAALFTAPIWVLVFSALLGRRIGLPRMLAVALGFLGVLVMLRPDPANLSAVALMPVAAGALYGLSNLVTRELCADESVAALLAGFFGALGLAGAAALALIAQAPPPAGWIESAPFLTAGWASPTARFLFWTFVQAAGSLVAVAMVTRGYQSAETSRLAVFEYSFLVSASFWSWALWGEALDVASVLGIALIVTAGAIIALQGGGAVRPRAGRAHP